MATNKVLILNKIQIQQKINRIAYQILEDNLDEKEIILAGIWNRGYKFAERLNEVLQTVADFKITMLRIDLEKDESHLVAKVDLEEQHWENKTIILVDDVLSSGKTMCYGLGVFLNSPVKKIRTVVLVDRSHKLFPIAIDFVGLQMATVLKEHITVVMDVDGEEDCVYLS
ncbi:MAG: phosphoribosyltransferase [Sphingobacteriaceae bacterium]|nr:phosphoribosyltransferase [Sphingobacteriaceae bacterium]